MSEMSALEAADPDIHELVRKETKRQDESIRLIASENYVSSAVMEATGSVLCNKYSEGYPGRRYYEGQEFIDQVESLAIERAKALFGAAHANVQPYSGSPANQAVYLALLDAGDTVMGLALPFGGHITHGLNVNFSGKLYEIVPYGVDRRTHRIDMNMVEDLARKARPKLIFCGGTAYPRHWDFEGFAQIASAVGAVLVADIAHVAGLVVAGAHPHPFPHAQIVTTTTHKTLRGPRGGMILSDGTYAKELDRAVFPGLQGGPHDHTTAAIAVALKEAATEEFKAYGHQIVANAKALAEALDGHGLRLISGGTDNHLILIDVTPRGINGKPAAQALNRAGIECNYNAIPFDPRKPFAPSGLRIGTPAVTSRGMLEPEMSVIAAWIDRVLANADDETELARVRTEVVEFCQAFPAPGIRV
ncbi:serine hydroxymethyltransferase [Candidatus Rariloculus sp.]|uniref:serine hydroxymethyltransferase n=1 Tax=Candidatus Rariloculus sp. TaxID=3101265 RepID=UPI003D0F6795